MVLLPLVPEFQFHKGAIRTLVDRTPCTLDSYFNSIKVRLEHGKLVILHLVIGNFNSIKVRLELQTNAFTFIYMPFQFHKGAIRTLH